MSSNKKDKKAKKICKYATDEFFKSDYFRALTSIDKAINMSNGIGSFHRIKASILNAVASEDVDFEWTYMQNAILSCRRAIELSPTYIEYYYLLSKLLLEVSDFDGVIKICAEGLQVKDPANCEIDHRFTKITLINPKSRIDHIQKLLTLMSNKASFASLSPWMKARNKKEDFKLISLFKSSLDGDTLVPYSDIASARVSSSGDISSSSSLPQPPPNAQVEQAVQPGSLQRLFSDIQAIHKKLNQVIDNMQKESVETTNERTVEKDIKAKFSALWAPFEEEDVKNKKVYDMQEESQKLTATSCETINKRTVENAVNAKFSELRARFDEECAKNKKVMIDSMKQITDMVTGIVEKELANMIDTTLKKEIGHTISPAVLNKTFFMTLRKEFQSGVGENMANQLEKSVSEKFESTLAKEIKVQFRTAWKQALVESMKSCLEAKVVPAYESFYNAMFERVEKHLKKRIIEALQHIETQHSAVAPVLREATNLASSLNQTLNEGKFAEGQRNLIELATAVVNSEVVDPLTPLNPPREMYAPLEELSKLIAEHKYEEAIQAVKTSCQEDMHKVLLTVPVPFSQGQLLHLLEQLACDIHIIDMPRKWDWMTNIVLSISPINMHVRHIFFKVIQMLSYHLTLSTTSEVESIQALISTICEAASPGSHQYN